ncbi:hypothetical protein [Novosphingobium sp. 9U]|uniref:hypothetical protein n=1 Tax=Novosphingobium sp. 9U TaxID=2653158 RepID=UPI0012F0D9C1|nr:hypothetical protein [Novosphingobium sp. 9U]VWX52808.1 hypothetical protein NOVOSPHI9U_420051 [Novosphingobium sp. 9U]
MTKSDKAKALRLTGGIMGGGLVAGMLMALAIPTTMAHKGETLRDLIGVPDAQADTTPVLAFEAPPEDLTPVNWQTAQQEYPSEAYVTPVADYGADLLDNSAPLPGEGEPLPPESLDAPERPSTVILASVGDAADDSAQAARDAAADVRHAESAASEPQPARAAANASANASAPVVVTDLTPASVTPS